MKSHFYGAMFALALSSCQKRQFNEESTTKSDTVTSWRTVPGISFFTTHEKPTWLFHYSDGSSQRNPLQYLQESEAHWNKCQEKLRRGESDAAAKEGECSNGGVWRGMGLYFAGDPFVSSAYGNTLVAVRIKPSTVVPSLYSNPNGEDWGNEYPPDKLEALWRTDVPGTRYGWGVGYFSQDSVIVRDMKSLLTKSADGKLEVYQFSGWQNNGGLRAGVSFSNSPSLACEPSESFEKKLAKAVYHPYFMDAVAHELKIMRHTGEKVSSLLNEEENGLSLKGKIWAIFSEINALIPKVQNGLKKISNLSLSGELSGVTSINHLSMEYFEVFIKYKLKDNEKIDYSWPAWFVATGFLPAGSENNPALGTAKGLAEALATQWSLRPDGEKRALEAYKLTECILNDMKSENISQWKFTVND